VEKAYETFQWSNPKLLQRKNQKRLKEMKDKSIEVLSEITVFTKYAKYLPEKERREAWEEIVDRNKNMHQKKYPQLAEEIENVYQNYVKTKKILPSMRSLQFGGKPIEISPNRVYNCAYLPVDDWRAFGEIMFLLLGGTGVGYSVQRHHIEKLPEISKPRKSRRYLISDSIEGWADAVKYLVKSYFHGGYKPAFDFSDIRNKGARLVTSGGKAPGPEPLKRCLMNIELILERKQDGEILSPIEVHDIVCHIADAVLAGGIRRAALISLFSFDDENMRTCKFGNWWELNPQRGRANNSAVILRNKIEKDDFVDLWKKIEASGSGEPGIYFNNDKDWGTNPCCEIALRPFQFCNLTEVNVDDVETQEEYEARCKAAAFVGTLQAGYTDFHYLRPVWKRNTEKDALIGVGMTGIGSGRVLNLDMKAAAGAVKEENARIASAIGINKAARTTTVKPSGTSSLVLGCSSGIHAWHNDYYIRRMRVGKNEAMYSFLSINHPELVKDEFFSPTTTAVIELPIKAPEGAILRTESSMDLLERVKRVYLEWIKPGHRSGNNTHNISATISVKSDEWEIIGDWMWKNKHCYNGLSVLPYDGGTYTQAPFEDITKEQFDELSYYIKDINLKNVIELEDVTDLKGEAACAGGACEIV
jgi:ribonucleoside-triphosphate reductase